MVAVCGFRFSVLEHCSNPVSLPLAASIKLTSPSFLPSPLPMPSDSSHSHTTVATFAARYFPGLRPASLTLPFASCAPTIPCASYSFHRASIARYCLRLVTRLVRNTAIIVRWFLRFSFPPGFVSHRADLV